MSTAASQEQSKDIAPPTPWRMVKEKSGVHHRRPFQPNTAIIATPNRTSIFNHPQRL